jgi:hypothetical protein
MYSELKMPNSMARTPFGEEAALGRPLNWNVF